jgi:hypothetical protein
MSERKVEVFDISAVADRERYEEFLEQEAPRVINEQDFPMSTQQGPAILRVVDFHETEPDTTDKYIPPIC